MLSLQEIVFIRDEIFRLLHFTYSGEVEVVASECLTVEGDKAKAIIGISSKSELARGFFLLAKELKAGKEKISIKQKACFNTCGVMLDFSRGCIYKTSAVKKYLAHMAALGMNMLLLYLEDTYELPGYPYFGYMRGRYSAEEIREIDDYADALGIELIPCVQTLGHMDQYLKWQEAAPVRDSAAVLLVGEEKTYEFIRQMLKTLSSMFRSRRIHIGMDEAHTMGQGKYAKLHETVDTKQMFIEHLKRVKELCEEEGLSPMIWSDMIFRVCGGEGGVNEEYDPNSVITPDIAEAIAGLNLSYWDYYRKNQDEYDGIIARHQKFDAEISFAGGVWTWDGYLPNFRYTFDTMLPAMRACVERGITEVYATCWGSDGTDADYIQAIPGLAIFSEFCYRGIECSENDIFEIAEYLTGVNVGILSAASEFYLGEDGAVSIGKRLFDADVLYEILRYPIDYEQSSKRFRAALDILHNNFENDFAEYATVLLEIVAEKSEIFNMLRPAYQKRDMVQLQTVAEKMFRLISLYENFFEKFEDVAEENRKPFGIELIQIRFAGIISRLKYAHNKLNEFLEGAILLIPELEEETLCEEKATWLNAKHFMNTMLK